MLTASNLSCQIVLYFGLGPSAFLILKVSLSAIIRLGTEVIISFFDQFVIWVISLHQPTEKFSIMSDIYGAPLANCQRLVSFWAFSLVLWNYAG